MIHKLIKRLATIFFIFFLLTFHVHFIYAQENKNYFDVNASLTYQVLSGTQTFVTQKISIINKKEYVYSPSYAITMHLKNIKDISVKNASGDIPFTLSQGANDAKTIEINFPQKVVGLGASNNFTFSFYSSDFTQKVGSILTVTVPALSGGADFNKYNIHILVPENYQNPTIVKPEVSYTKNKNTYSFSNNPLLKNGIELIFGDSQVYQFGLTYHLENKNVFPIRTEIALPPNTSYQEVLLNDLSPHPDNTYEDADGNILASYTIPPKTTINAIAQVLIKVAKNPKQETLSSFDKSLYTKPQKYWEVNDSEIKKIASGLKTPEDIFNYVVKTLSYDTKKANDNNLRLGAKTVLSRPYFAVCLEFTDLFITLARASGIPARAVEGYAYTNDVSGKPLSLFQDVLHAWPEYYDTIQKTWIMVDPTWENTTGGIDYFHTLDFDHVAFVINGSKSTYPIPAGGYKIQNGTKDVVVSFPNPSIFVKKKQISANGTFSSFTNDGSVSGKVTLENNGNYELLSYNAQVYLDGSKTESLTFPKIPPLGRATLSVSIPFPNKKTIPSLTNISHNVTIQGEDGQILVKTTIHTFPFSQYLIIGGAIFIGAAFILILAFKTRSVPFQG